MENKCDTCVIQKKCAWWKKAKKLGNTVHTCHLYMNINPEEDEEDEQVYWHEIYGQGIKRSTHECRYAP